MEESETSFAKIEESDLERLALLSREDRDEFFSRQPRWQQLYANRLLCVALCQGAAVHYVDGVKDFDIWTFYAQHPDEAFSWRRVGRKDYWLFKARKESLPNACSPRSITPMANEDRPLAADPYAHQPDGAWKTERQQSDRQLLSQLFGMTEGEVYEGSKKFHGRERKFFEFLFAMRFVLRRLPEVADWRTLQLYDEPTDRTQ